MTESLRASLKDLWENHAQGVITSALTILGILLVAWIIHRFLVKLTAWLLRRSSAKQEHDTEHRLQTLLPLLAEVERYAIYTLVVVAVLAHFGVDARAILASVGVVSIALGFGAQNLVKDMIAGFFLLFDGIVAVGDIVRTDERTIGVVEAVGIRNTQIRDFSGLLWMIPNGDLRQFGNMSRGWMRAVVIVELPYDANIPQAMALVREVGESWAAANAEKVLEPPEAQALLAMTGSSVSLRLIIKLKPGEQWAAERALRLMIKDSFEAAGISAPYPRQVLIDGKLVAESQAARALQQAAPQERDRSQEEDREERDERGEKEDRLERKA